MLKRLFVAVALIAAPLTAASAQNAPASADDCFKMVIDLQKSAAEKKLADDRNAKIEELLTRMEGQCEAEKFADAAATTTEIKAAIDAK